MQPPVAGTDTEDRPGPGADVVSAPPLRVWRQLPVYAVGLWAGSLAGFVLVPIYTRAIPVADYGTYEILSRGYDLVLSVLRMGIVIAMMRMYALLAERERTQAVSTALIWMAAVGVLTAGAATVFRTPLAAGIIGDAAYAPHIALVGAWVAFELIYSVSAGLLRVREQALLFTVAAVGRFALTIVLNLYLVLGLNLGLMGILVGNVAASGLSALAMTLYAFASVGIAFSGWHLKRMLAFGAPLLLSAVPITIASTADRYILKSYASVTDVAIFGLGAKLASLLTLAVFAPVGLMYLPFVFNILRREGERAPAIYARATTYVTLGAGWAVLALILFSPQVVGVLAPAPYRAAATIGSLYLLGALLFGLAPQIEVGIYLQGRTIWKPVAAGLLAVTCVGLDFALIPRFHALGAALAYLLAQPVYLGALYLIGRRLYPIPYEWGRLARAVAAGTLCWAVGSAGAMWAPSAWMSWGVRLAALGMFPLVLHALRFPTAAESKAVRRRLLAVCRRLGRRLSPQGVPRT